MLTFDAHGLIPAIIQDAATGEVLMLAYMNAEALRLTRATGITHFWSRSREQLWQKGEQSGHSQEVVAIQVNCEENSLLVKVRQHGPGACHDGYRSCYYRELRPDDSLIPVMPRVFDPHLAYSGERSAAPESQLERRFRQLYQIYEHLRDADFTAVSATSRALHEANLPWLLQRAREELRELQGVLAGTHRHSADRAEDIVLEGYQTCYWLCLVAIAARFPYDRVAPHQQMLRGYTDGAPDAGANHGEAEFAASRTDVLPVLGAGFAHVGAACRQGHIHPIALLERDLAELRTRPYLAAIWKPE
jgi:phosphoribosyl-AMP cyclohydrolase